MLVVGLTGGVGSGKSTVADLFVRHGALSIDADEVAREVVDLETVGLSAIVDRFGPDYLTEQGTLDRPSLAGLVFSDATARKDLNAIVHPLVRIAIEARLRRMQAADPSAVVLLVVPLLVESGHYETDLLVVVDCEEEVAIRRLVETRGWTEDEARARLVAQASRSERRAAADLVIDNSGSIEDLQGQVDAAWRRITQLHDA